MPWKNGGGTTLEIARDANEPPHWRLSVATIAQSGPFSEFPGYDRSIAAIGGGPVTLSVDARALPLRPNEPHAFRGESSAHAVLAGSPARDFNVMTLRAHATHVVQYVDLAAHARLAVPANERAFIYVPGGDTLVIDGPCDLDLAPELGLVQAFVVRIRQEPPRS